MNIDKIPRGDLAYASRVEVLSLSRLSGTTGGSGGYHAASSSSSSSSSSPPPSPPSSTPTKRNLDEAERVLREALLSIKRPKLTYHALFLAYLKAGPVYMHKAQQLIIEMKDRGIHPPDQIEVGLTLSYHSHKQVFLPLIHP